jgi:hypothetical protein
MKRFVCINEHSNFKAVCFQFLRKVFQVNHRLFMGINLNSCSLIGILCSVLLLECRGITRIMIVTNLIDFNDGKLLSFLPRQMLRHRPHPVGYFPDRKTRLAQCPSAAVTVPPGL